jgi:prepilin-type processing-associated H-X9-DG protein
MHAKKIAWGLGIALVLLLLAMRIVLFFAKSTPPAESEASAPATPPTPAETPAPPPQPAPAIPAPPAPETQQVETPAEPSTPPADAPTEEEAAARQAAAANLQQIAKAIIAYNNDHGEQAYLADAQSGDAAHSVAILLATRSDLNDPNLYFVPGDPLGPKTLPQSVTVGDGADATANPDFAQATLSVVVAGAIPPNSPPATTPIMWTRGMQSDGAWAPDSPFHGQGGYVVFLDGHIEWYGAKSDAASPQAASP